MNHEQKRPTSNDVGHLIIALRNHATRSRPHSYRKASIGFSLVARSASAGVDVQKVSQLLSLPEIPLDELK